MASSDTCWTVIRSAAAGDEAARSSFVRLYSPAARAYLRARWRSSPLVQDIEDAVQEFFVDCFKEGGVLDEADPSRPAGFRPFLYAVARNVARRAETRWRRNRERQAASSGAFEQLEGRDDALSLAFDRAWARSIVAEAAARQRRVAEERGEEAVRRVELLRLRFQDGLPPREIAALWGEDPARVHREYGKARREFEDHLLEVVSFHEPLSREAALRECRRLLGLLK